MLTDIQKAQLVIESELKKLIIPLQPENLYDPVRYILSNGGKRIRPALTLMACNLFTDDYKKAIFPALGVEVFHNFTLLHDDLMDNSSLRRNDPTVHEKWNPNIAILSGDVMSIMAVQLISRSEKDIMSELLNIFNHTALGVCEGQMLDMDFGKRNDITVNDYIRMIGLKTSVLLAASLQIGSLAGGASMEIAVSMYDFGFNLGLGFQLQDDLLDTYGNQKKFGKKIGNDILNNKKTYLFIKSLELSGSNEKKRLLELYEENNILQPEDKINAVMEIFNKVNIKAYTEEIISDYFNNAIKIFQKINAPSERKKSLESFVQMMIRREY